MSLYGALFSGVSGLAAQSNALGIISDNIANVNTVGYKTSITRFSSLVTQEVSVTRHSSGGVISSAYANVDQQGLLQSTASGTDLAIAGDGFFVVNENANPTVGSNYLFTRAGQFTPDENGDLVNAAGFYLQGYNMRTNPNPPPSASTFTGLETVNVSNLSGNAESTANLSMDVNLPSTAAVGDTHTVTMQIFDSLGNPHDLDINFTKTGINTWDFGSSDPVSEGAVTGTSAGAGNLVFAPDGTPSAINFTTPFTVNGWTTGAANSAFTLDLGTAGSTDGLTQFAGEFAITDIDQDGVRFGVFTGVTINEEGIVTALFDNGQNQDIFRMPLGMFNNPNGLNHLTGNAYQQTDDSGNFQLSLATTNGAGSVSASTLESSTVDLADEFTNMIVTQRAYSASARTITTADDMLEELIRIRR
ncbi:MAG: flagellar hook protein FlgE [Pseudomonadota bacterium]